MNTIRDKLSSMFSKVMAGTVTREEGAILINSLVREDRAETVKVLAEMLENPPPGVFPKTILHTVSLCRNKAFNNLLISALEHTNEEVSILAAQGLASLRTEEARNVLIDHLESDVYHVRKASANALVEGFGEEGVKILTKHVLSQSEPFYISTSVDAIVKAGRKGVDALIGLLGSDNQNVVVCTAEVLSNIKDELKEDDIRRIVDALMSAGDRNNTSAIIPLLKVMSALQGKAKRFREYIQVFAEYPVETVQDAAREALRMMDAG